MNNFAPQYCIFLAGRLKLFDTFRFLVDTVGISSNLPKGANRTAFLLPEPTINPYIQPVIMFWKKTSVIVGYRKTSLLKCVGILLVCE